MARIELVSQLKNLQNGVNQLRGSCDKLAIALMREKTALYEANISVGMVLLGEVGILVPVSDIPNDRKVVERLGVAYINAVNQIGD